jgi:AcrR family transcriptional regulator
MDPKAAGKYHHGDLQRALLDAAIVALERTGPKRFSLRALALELNVSHAAAYRHFRNRDALIEAVAIEGMELLTKALIAAAGDGDDPRAILRSCALAYVGFGLDHPGLYQVMFSDAQRRSQPTQTAADSTLVLTSQVIAAAQQAGGVGPGEPIVQARAAWAMMHGLVDLELRGQFTRREPLSAMAHAEMLIDFFLNGLYAD